MWLVSCLLFYTLLALIHFLLASIGEYTCYFHLSLCVLGLSIGGEILISILLDNAYWGRDDLFQSFLLWLDIFLIECQKGEK